MKEMRGYLICECRKTGIEWNRTTCTAITSTIDYYYQGVLLQIDRVE